MVPAPDQIRNTMHLYKREAERLRVRVKELEAELAARDFVPITDEHRDGGKWLTGRWVGTRFIQAEGRYDSDYGLWRDADRCAMYWNPTHAAPLPKPPAQEGK